MTFILFLAAAALTGFAFVAGLHVACWSIRTYDARLARDNAIGHDGFEGP